MAEQSEITNAVVRAFLEDCGVDLAAPENFPGRADSLVTLMASFGAAVDHRARIAARERAIEECAKLMEGQWETHWAAFIRDELLGSA